jgi:hypothetical protein
MLWAALGLTKEHAYWMVPLAFVTIVPGVLFDWLTRIPEGVEAEFSVIALNGLIGTLLQGAGGAVVSAISVPVLASTMSGGPRWSTEIRGRVNHFLGPLLLANIAILFPIYLGMVFLLVPGVWLLLRLMLIDLAVVFEGTTGLASLPRSFELTRGHALRLLGVIFVLYLPYTLLQLGQGGFLSGLMSSLVLSIGLSVLQCFLILLYLRIRHGWLDEQGKAKALRGYIAGHEGEAGHPMD